MNFFGVSMKHLFFIFGLLGGFFSLHSQAANITLVVSDQQISLGSTVELQVQMAGLEGDLSLGDYDLAVHYDASLFNLNNVFWGDALKGNQLDLNGLGSVQSANESTPGLLNLFELSLDTPSDVDNRQAGSFSLFSLFFSAIGEGAGQFSGSVNALGDSIGNSIMVDTFADVEVKVSKVPEPSSLLIMIGFIALGLSRYRGVNIFLRA
jgi:hypothetical protein